MNDTFTSHYLTTNRQRLTESYDFVTTFLKSHRIPYCQSNAAFFLWIRLGAATADTKATDDEILAKLRDQRVYIAAGYAYASEESGWFRMVFAHPRDVLEEGLKRMLQALAS
jgi:bifunctional pyridoxal-dependent enzyme with beta-cystathionase and maltose regulon repressor activities